MGVLPRGTPCLGAFRRPTASGLTPARARCRGSCTTTAHHGNTRNTRSTRRWVLDQHHTWAPTGQGARMRTSTFRNRSRALPSTSAGFMTMDCTKVVMRCTSDSPVREERACRGLPMTTKGLVHGSSGWQWAHGHTVAPVMDSSLKPVGDSRDGRACTKPVPVVPSAVPVGVPAEVTEESGVSEWSPERGVTGVAMPAAAAGMGTKSSIASGARWGREGR